MEGMDTDDQQTPYELSIIENQRLQRLIQQSSSSTSADDKEDDKKTARITAAAPLPNTSVIRIKEITQTQQRQTMCYYISEEKCDQWFLDYSSSTCSSDVSSNQQNDKILTHVPIVDRISLATNNTSEYQRFDAVQYNSSSEENCSTFPLSIIEQQRMQRLWEPSDSNSPEEKIKALPVQFMNQSFVHVIDHSRKGRALYSSSSSSSEDEADRSKSTPVVSLYKPPAKISVDNTLRSANLFVILIDSLKHINSNQSCQDKLSTENVLNEHLKPTTVPIDVDSSVVKTVKTNNSQCQDLCVLRVILLLIMRRSTVMENKKMIRQKLFSYKLKQPEIIEIMFLYFCVCQYLNTGKYGKAFSCLQKEKAVSSYLIPCTWTSFLYRAEAVLLLRLGQINPSVRKSNFKKARECYKLARDCSMADSEKSGDAIYWAIWFSIKMSLMNVELTCLSCFFIAAEQNYCLDECNFHENDLQQAKQDLKDGTTLLQLLALDRHYQTKAKVMLEVGALYVELREAQLFFKRGRHKDCLEIVNEMTKKIQIMQQSINHHFILKHSQTLKASLDKIKKNY